jgi:hypothetical protein
MKFISRSLKDALVPGLDLPVLVADDDFIEHLHELGFVDTIDMNDLVFEWLDWAKENVAK